jgi:hypothetical protein
MRTRTKTVGINLRSRFRLEKPIRKGTKRTLIEK